MTMKNVIKYSLGTILTWIQKQVQLLVKVFIIFHDDVIKWKHFPRYWPFVRGIHRSPVKSPHKGQWRGALIFSLMCAYLNVWVNTREAGDLRRYRLHYDVIVMLPKSLYMTGYRKDIFDITACKWSIWPSNTCPALVRESHNLSFQINAVVDMCKWM